MALWFDCGNGWAKTSFARSDIGSDVYLCCPGPSLADAKIQSAPGVFIAAINTAYPKVRPDVWFGMDDPRCYDRRLWSEAFLKFYRGNYKDKDVEGQPVRLCPMTFFADLEEMRVDEMFQRRAHDTVFAWFKHTLGVALHGLVWMGAKNIHLVGCDMGGTADYWHGTELTEDQRNGNRLLYRSQVDFLRRFDQHARPRGIKLTSCTDLSPLNAFLPYVPIDQALAASAARVPASGTYAHCKDVQQETLRGPDFKIHSVRQGLEGSRAGARHGGRDNS